jgi:hypothetical protein
MPLDGAFLAVAGLASVAALIKSVGALCDPACRRPGREAAAVLLLTLAITCYALSDRALAYHDLGRRLDSPDRLLTDVVTMTATFAVLSLLLLLSQPFTQAWPRIGHRLIALGACACGMTFAAAFSPPLPTTASALSASDPEMLIYFTLYTAFLGITLAEMLTISWQHARGTWHRRPRYFGLLLMCAGAVAGLIALTGQTAWAFVAAPHMLPPSLPAARSCAGLVTPLQCGFTVALPGVSVLLAGTGAALPAITAALAKGWRYWRNLQMFLALEPLWNRLCGAFPQISLPEHGGRRRLDVAFRLYRRVIEIGDGCLMLRPYTRPEMSAAAAADAAGFGLRGDELRATVEAAAIVAALRARRSSIALDPPPPDHCDAEVGDLLVEASWLVKVARAYATSPVVYHLATHRR